MKEFLRVLLILAVFSAGIGLFVYLIFRGVEGAPHLRPRVSEATITHAVEVCSDKHRETLVDLDRYERPVGVECGRTWKQIEDNE